MLGRSLTCCALVIAAAVGSGILGAQQPEVSRPGLAHLGPAGVERLPSGPPRCRQMVV